MALYINGQEVYGGGGSGASSLEDLTDVNITTPTNGQTIVYDSANSEWVNGEGGGNHWEGTYLEYLALPTKDPDTVYFITDINDGNDRFQPIFCSSEEQVIGVFIDGKPIYQKTIEVSQGSSEQSYPAPDYVDKIWFAPNLSFIKATSGGNYASLGYYYGSSDKFQAYYQASNNTIRIAASWAGTGYLTVRYTKTTDTAGSGAWTPQGIPSQHYSTSEQVVGTWVNGTTVYEKSISISESSFGTGWKWFATNISNFNLLLTTMVYLKDSTNTYCYSSLPTCFRYSDSYIGIYNGLGGTLGNISGYVTLRYTKTS